MYNSKGLKQFIERVNKEASTAAQAVYDSHQNELNARIKAQLRKGDKLINSMGRVWIEREGKEDITEGDFIHTLRPLLYRQELDACFDLDNITP